ncbi:Piso0_005185 [Millerozyma farinosa CBS 7064]|uniref:Acyl-coenzyme A diphosphatase SCS3 n=1 Tax=Pichia sorbitophila (strain ATCC MYA-4447 / BCRC 22081 / CBS 7064 / NBRC 10061 / NRRL Y-12695) TaxID=559304 RepID=G8Y1H9_PICSO|nr:Piso0_005185 [Millerozyma farinosa CBS 7064]
MSSTVRNNDELYNRHYNILHTRMKQFSKSIGATSGEVLFLGSFVLNFMLGKLIHVFSSQEAVYNYYNDKRNILNQFFVKKGWAWTTVVIVVFYILILRSKHPKVQSQQEKIRLLRNGLIKYSIMTFWWVLFTQWCFGLPIMDKVFVWTGGKCQKVAEKELLRHFPGALKDKFFSPSSDGESFEASSITSYTCRKLKGAWTGGHDPSGHVFLLVHSSLYLFLETSQFWGSWPSFFGSARNLCGKLRRVPADQSAEPKSKLAQVVDFFHGTPHFIVFLLLSLWWFMLLMTNIYFHSLAEKLVGLLFAYAGALLVYYLPRYLGSSRIST